MKNFEQREAEYLAKAIPPEAVLKTIRTHHNWDADQAVRIIKGLQYDSLSDYWHFTYRGLYYGVERDGYIHT